MTAMKEFGYQKHARKGPCQATETELLAKDD